MTRNSASSFSPTSSPQAQRSPSPLVLCTGIPHSPPSLPDDILQRILEYVPSTAGALLPLCSLNHAWRRVATRDNVWEPAIKQQYGQLLLERLEVAKGVHSFYLGQQHARYAHQSLLRPHGAAGQMVCCTPSPDSFFANFTWILEIREGKDKTLVYSAAVALGEVEDRGRLFTSSGHSVVGDGLRLGIDIKSRLRPPPPNFDGGGGILPRRRRNSSMWSGFGLASAVGGPTGLANGGGGWAKKEARKVEKKCQPIVGGGSDAASCCQEEPGGKESDDTMLRKKTAAAAAAAVAAAADATDNEDNEDEDEDEDASLLFTLSLYNKHTHASACFISTRLVTDRPPRWQGRYWDGPFSGADGQPTTRIVLDPTHTLIMLPIVEMVDWGDKTLLLMVRVDLRICQCAEEGEEEVGGREGGAMNMETGRMNQVGCRCSPFDGLGMIHEEGMWILLRDLLVNKLRWF
ncbi:hypothetical protein VYU27_007444 [Nannochloropsis oceanica]